MNAIIIKIVEGKKVLAIMLFNALFFCNAKCKLKIWKYGILKENGKERMTVILWVSLIYSNYSYSYDKEFALFAVTKTTPVFKTLAIITTSSDLIQVYYSYDKKAKVQNK